jgi:four helix bundle protein
MENTETRVWLDFALAFGYLTNNSYTELFALSEEIGKLLNHMMHYPEKYRGSMQSKK